ncbi:MAG TPA: hypothetical protein VFR93_00905 [Candidatus Limnocylindrales bacterium]|nr:hypothetical protein [Candidatus Limnocylindrales bacterium]
MKRNSRILAAMMAILAMTALAGPVAARDGDVTRTGDCSGRADWKLKGGARDGRIEVEFQVDSNRVGQTWRVRLSDNGDVFFRGKRQTLAPSGSFSVERRTANRAGTDRIVGFARNLASGQTCRGVIRIP